MVSPVTRIMGRPQDPVIEKVREAPASAAETDAVEKARKEADAVANDAAAKAEILEGATAISNAAATLASIRKNMPAVVVAAARGSGCQNLFNQKGTGSVAIYSDLRYMHPVERPEYEKSLEGADSAESERHGVSERKRVKLSALDHGPGWETEEGRAVGRSIL